MKVTIVGTGNMARGIATRVLAGGHHVAFVGTALGKAEELADEFEGEGTIGASEDAEGDVVVLAVSYTEAPHAVRQHGASWPARCSWTSPTPSRRRRRGRAPARRAVGP